MTYTLEPNELTRILQKDICKKVDERNGMGIEVVADGDCLVIDGKRVRVMKDYEFTYRVRRDGIHSYKTPDEWVEELKKDMNDPERFWSETYWTMLRNAYSKCKAAA